MSSQEIGAAVSTSEDVSIHCDSGHLMDQIILPADSNVDLEDVEDSTSAAAAESHPRVKVRSVTSTPSLKRI